MSSFPTYDWTEFYGDVQEAIPHDMPEHLGKDLTFACFAIVTTQERNVTGVPALAS